MSKARLIGQEAPRGLKLGRRVALMVAWACIAFRAPVHADALQVVSARSLADLTLEELREVRVTSVSRRDQSLLEAAASIFVISGDEVRRSGATTLPEALRLAPNLQVAAIDARQYAISARGFNGNIANKLLVMVDGRTIYSPLFSGTFWDAQDFIPSDIDRIEVISGPASATWGTNAVHGVINVVTLPASRTQGAAVSMTTGNLETTVAGRYGFTVADDIAVRAHVRSFRRDASQLRSGGDLSDASRGSTAGLRADWSGGPDAVSLIAGLYTGSTDTRPTYGSVNLRGSNLTGKWSRQLDESRSFDVQVYYDRTEREDNFLLQDDAQIFDVEADYRQMTGSHRLLMGAGYRRTQDSSQPGLIFAFLPAQQKQSWYNVFVHDEVTLTDRTSLTVGLRMEHNPYTGWEALPSIRLGYRQGPGTLLWGALSRAVRSPSRFDREIFVPTQPPFVVAGGPNFVSEVANVAEIGYRAQLGAHASVSATGFVHDYSRLRSGEIVGTSFQFENKIAGQVRGIEAWGNWQPLRAWRLDAGLLWLSQRLRLTEGSSDPTGPSNLGNDARLQWSLQSTHSFSDRLEARVAVRHVGKLPSPVIPSYTATDVTLNWLARKDLQLSWGVRDAFDSAHAEYQGFSTISEIPRAFFLSLNYSPR
jgi:iron complex outermembrane receptor protein